MSSDKNPTYRKADTCANCALSDVASIGENRNKRLVCKKYEQQVTRFSICDDHEKTEEYL